MKRKKPTDFSVLTGLITTMIKNNNLKITIERVYFFMYLLHYC